MMAHGLAEGRLAMTSPIPLCESTVAMRCSMFSGQAQGRALDVGVKYHRKTIELGNETGGPRTKDKDDTVR